ncbi:YigZ family protein [Bacillus suaedaesalsae]|uniref:YigZ family protein n=1 Tax=Bacillus suaedaesalsae TaxID=2810349 RepID=A0ABS2DKR7_9BACI|nr:YigZ family protein [Bacillus suaedaesalsae]MBM6619064.1 YigZ family protein [Bacillus suaedaesalsae]
MLLSYKTIKGNGEHEIIIEKSRFICYIDRATTEEEAQAFISRIKKANANANHNCSAYLIGEHDQIQKANDDGEPSGTAGVPILEVLKKKGLKGTVVVISRYFGGIKLGAGGLIRAYGKATSEGIIHTGIVERKLMRIMSVVVDYTWVGKIENELRSSEYQVKSVNYTENVEFEIYVEENRTESFCAWMIELTNGQGEIIQGTSEYLEKEI